jgi:hypothetical protein
MRWLSEKQNPQGSFQKQNANKTCQDERGNSFIDYFHTQGLPKPVQAFIIAAEPLIRHQFTFINYR